MKIRFNKRKWWHFKESKSIHFEISGFTCNPCLYFRLDGDEREVKFHIALLGVGLWFSFEGFLPRSWYPSYWCPHLVDMNFDGWMPTEREISISWHNGCLWWCFWMNPDEWSSKDPKYRRGCFHVFDLIKGKHKYEKIEIDRRQILLPFFEGVYNVEVVRNKRIDSYKHWFTRRMETWEVRCGYYDETNKWIELGIPKEGKGENSWDCDEDATYAMSFPGRPYNQLSTPYEASLYFWNSMMKDRERYGHEKWLPQRFKNKKIEIIRKSEVA